MTDMLRPSRLILSAAIPDAEFNKRLTPDITNRPDLPTIAWDRVGQVKPGLLATPATLPAADAVVITWAEAEWAALEQVFCSSDTPMPYSKRTESTWNGWQKYDADAPADLGYWGYYRLVQIGTAKVLLLKSNAHYAANQGEQNLEQLSNILVDQVGPTVILSVGTAGGARTSDPIGTVNVVHVDALYNSAQPQSGWLRYPSPWAPDWTLINDPAFASLLMAIPTTAPDLTSIAKQFNKLYGTNYPLTELNPDNLNMGAASPAINNLAVSDTALVTARSFVVADTSGNLKSFACVEMDDAIIARTVAGKAGFGSVRNISDPIQNASLPPACQGHWGEAIYNAYGFYTSFNGALTAWALLVAQFSGTAAHTAVGSTAAAASADLTHATALQYARESTARTERRARRRLQTTARNDAEAHRLRGWARVLKATAGTPPVPQRLEITNVYCKSDYTAQLLIGSGGAKANVILDTGSSTLAVEPHAYSGSGDANLKTSTELQLVTYGTGGWAGPVVSTSLSFKTAGGNVALTACPIALTDVQEKGNFTGVDGIMGLAYNGLNSAYDFKTYLAEEKREATFPWPFGKIWTSFVNGFQDLITKANASPVNPAPYFDVVEEAGIAANKFAFYTLRSFVSVATGTSEAAMLTNPLNKGYFILGGDDEQTDLYEEGAPFLEVQVVHDLYYNTNLKSVRVGTGATHTAEPLQTKWRQDAISNSIIDSGTSNLSLAQDVYDAIVQGLKAANPAFGPLIDASANGVDAASLTLASWPNIYFTLEGVAAPGTAAGPDVELCCTPQTYWQVDFPAAGQAVFQISGPLPSDDPDGPLNQSILGLPLMNNYYTVFDRSEDVNGVVRFAKIKALPGQA